MPLRSDIPITDISQDLFSRKPLTDIIVKAIREYVSYSTNCITIGIYGEWGEGKTSVMNIVKHRLEQLKYKDRLLIANYNPWLIKDQESMLVDFFRTVMGSGFSKKLYSYFRQYGNLITYIAGQASEKVAPLSGGTVSSLVSKLINGLPGNELSLVDSKEKISSQLKKENRHLIVFIDDLDRLNNREIHTVFRLIKQVADFENVIYLVAMDFDRVASALGSNNSYGSRFIDKIIQIPITLPKLQQADLLRELRRMLDELMKELDIPVDLLDIELVATNVIGLVRNERDITRFYNTLLLLLPSVKHELNLNDFCRLEFLNVYDTSIYKTIYNHGSELLRLHTSDMLVALAPEKADEEVEKRYNKTIDDFKQQYGPEVSTIVTKLFPKRFRSDDETAYERTSINHLEFFDRYFIRDYQEGSISHAEVSALLSIILSIDNDEIVAIITKWLETSDQSKTFAALDDVIMGNDRDVSTRAKRVKAIILAIISSNIANKLHVDQYEGNYYASKIVAWLQLYMLDADENGRIKYLEKEINEVIAAIFEHAPLLFCLKFLVSYNRSFGDLLKPEVFNVLRDRVIPTDSEKSYEEIVKFSRLELQTYFVVWNRVDSTSMHTIMSQWLNNQDFCSDEFIRRFVAPDNAILLDDLRLFLTIFESESDAYLDHLADRLGSYVKDTFFRKILANWKMVLENIKHNKQQ